ncbi:reverse transcriptase [Phytophthora megakarya]|uniref:Reverse transcriptase n=1 Tax=Phytophthora megakarya TaxID=4795 RepID=A0A225VZW2_9STRA|nr:reverse transcriptase [Phytophthora megakarya]
MTVRVLDAQGKPTRGDNIQGGDGLWILAEVEETAALRAKGVLEEIEQADLPEGAKAIKIMWMYAIKTDHQGYRTGIDFIETFASVDRMASFRLVLAIAAELDLKVLGDINTAYLNACLAIPQFIKSIKEFPCAVDGPLYIVRKDLYALRQPGREWDSKLNNWLLRQGFQRRATEPCLYFKYGLFVFHLRQIQCCTNYIEIDVLVISLIATYVFDNFLDCRENQSVRP